MTLETGVTWFPQNFGIFDFHAYFVPEVNWTPDTFHKVHNGEQEHGGTSGWYRDLSIGLQ